MGHHDFGEPGHEILGTLTRRGSEARPSAILCVAERTGDILRYLIVSDIHSNLSALEAVLSHPVVAKIDTLWCLGDVVGYGPQPLECLEAVASEGPAWVAGNHDLGASGQIELSEFNPEAEITCQWTNRQLEVEWINKFRCLPTTLYPQDEVTMVHASPRDPVWEYVLTMDIAEANFDHFKGPICFFGHTHMPTLVEKTETMPGQRVDLEEGWCVRLDVQGKRYLINPGSVGQPRDGDPRASFLVYDSDNLTIELFRQSYDVGRTQKLMEAARLPEFLIERIGEGV